MTPEGRGYVSEVSLLTGMLKVILEKNNTAAPFHRDDCKIVRGERPRVETPAVDKPAEKPETPDRPQRPRRTGRPTR
jgi:hypothetical protein